MQLTPEVLDATARALKMFRIGGAIIAAIPLTLALVPIFVGGRASDGAPFTVISVTLLLLVVWATYCGERFLKSLRQGMPAIAKR